MNQLKSKFKFFISISCLLVAIFWMEATVNAQVPRSVTNTITSIDLPGYFKDYIQTRKTALISNRRQEQINKVEDYFARYGSSLAGYGSIFVDKAHECGGDYRVLVGIAGSESGLGRVNVLKYNPFGYLNGVQYESQQQALEVLACQISKQHITFCGTDLYCLGRRYAGPSDDLDLFVSKVKFFFDQVD